jgi:Zinc carboxypeptidase
MTPSAQARQLAAQYETFKLGHLNPSNCTHRNVTGEIENLVRRSHGLLTIEELGASLEGRSINLVRCGNGPKRILLWSQMHGDESTATLALCDLFNFLCEAAGERNWVGGLLQQVSLAAIPMLNPDGAEAGTRQTASRIDVNRDAKALMTPEARILRETHRAIRPSFGFNLHDQALSSVGSSRNVTALALLAPALDDRRSRPLSRVKAMRVCALIAQSLRQFAGGHLATYDDAYEPRAFGDRMQSWGTSTILIESGHWPRDPMKAFIRKLNFVALFVALRSIADGTYQDVELEHYSSLEPNGKQVYDLIIRNIHLVHPSGWESRSDVALSLEPEYNRRGAAPLATVKEVGDLSTHAGLETLDGSARRIPHDVLGIDRQMPLSQLLDQLQLYRSEPQR